MAEFAGDGSCTETARFNLETTLNCSILCAMSTDESALKRTDYVALVECGKQLSAEVNINELLQQILNKAAELTDSPDGWA